MILDIIGIANVIITLLIMLVIMYLYGRGTSYKVLYTLLFIMAACLIFAIIIACVRWF